ncbi:bifunctional folylpolyglutamate synthase/dihydrofolate synthase [Larkinella punicea]|uniref:Dihydrofolate synthase/folylpolyglutamate synthase n=1 Tax=Larkinella punicea TaxID=2315727 RepID=A0A368JNA0_9BACT|nr:folylpolyglutamate synthase/dihydrofolate synthase family protein [Larkinella punicea]RCR68972.1 bifunctional folylpolyglutamate synthase/dihydrofolate synthase [Larkinella punicea]
MMYSEAIDYLYAQLPVFHRIGAKALKPGLDNILKLCEYLGNPQEKFRTIHVGGTNGKGSSSHLLAAVLQSAGYKTGLYTSPHLKSFTERIRVDGFPMPDAEVAHFVETHKAFIEDLKPSFFEVTVGMAFDYFARQNVDLAVVEVGLGGRLDSTNIITPLVSLITNIGWDHSDILGDSLQKIAYEKAGIIKPGVPVVISEYDAETYPVFKNRAEECGSDILIGSDFYKVTDLGIHADGRHFSLEPYDGGKFELSLALLGTYQLRNVAGVLSVLKVLSTPYILNNSIAEEFKAKLSESAVQAGFAKVVELTGLKGRWQILQQNPTVICDTAHNEPGILSVLESLQTVSYQQLHLVVGFVKDKDLSKVIRLFPKGARFYFCQPDIPRALDAEVLAEAFRAEGFAGDVFPDVNQALEAAKSRANPADCILVTGSTYVVAELNQLEA